jgi:hypothetical protein
MSMRLRSTVTIVDLELRVLVAYRAANGAYGKVPPMSVFDELLDLRLRLVALGRASLRDEAERQLSRRDENCCRPDPVRG